MRTHRRFLLAPALARLFRREFPSTQITEGHFQRSEDRQAHVILADERCELVSVSFAPGVEPVEERTAVPASQGQFLLGVCAGKAEYSLVGLGSIGLADVSVRCFSGAAPLDLVRVSFDDEGTAEGFTPPAWLGPEVTQDESYATYQIALRGPPRREEVALSNAALNGALDVIDNVKSPQSRTADVQADSVSIPAQQPVSLEARAAALVQGLSTTPIKPTPRVPRQLWATNPLDVNAQQGSRSSDPDLARPDWRNTDKAGDEDEPGETVA